MAEQSLCDVFVVDSDAKTRKELRTIASSCGYSVMVFADGQTALHELEKTSARLVILELLLPGLDGFELCQAIRTGLKLPELPLLCTSGISWGSIDLETVLKDRFNARFLPKGSLAKVVMQTLNDILGAPVLEKVQPVQHEDVSEDTGSEALDSGEFHLGQEEAERAEQLTREFEREIANVSLGSDGRQVRVQAEYQVQFKSLGELATEFTQNISRGGLFIYSESSPGIDAVVGLCLQIPGSDQPIEVKARVVHSVSPEQAREGKIRPGFGVEFLDLSRADREMMEKLVQDFESKRLKAHEPAPAGTISILLLGIPILPFVGRPNFLLRKNVKVAEFMDLGDAQEYLSQSRVDLAIVGEMALAQPGPLECMRKLDKLVEPATKRIIMLDRMRDLTEVLVEGLCHMVVDTTLTMESLLDEVSQRLDIKKRENLRVPYRARVAVRAPQQEFTGLLINISTGGLQMVSNTELSPGAMLRLGFSLAGGLLLTCRGEVVRKLHTADRKKFSYGIKFTELDGDAEEEIQKFVQSHVNFREYFRWMKKRYFEWP